MKLLVLGLLLGSLLINNNYSALAQSGYISCPLLLSPELANGGGGPAIDAAIYQQIIFPPECLRAEINGRVFIRLAVTPAGKVQYVSIVKELYEPFDRAVVRAAQQLSFKPHPTKEGVKCFVLGISFEKEIEWLMAHQRSTADRKAARRRNSTR